MFSMICCCKLALTDRCRSISARLSVPGDDPRGVPAAAAAPPPRGGGGGACECCGCAVIRSCEAAPEPTDDPDDDPGPSENGTSGSTCSGLVALSANRPEFRRSNALGELPEVAGWTGNEFRRACDSCNDRIESRELTEEKESRNDAAAAELANDANDEVVDMDMLDDSELRDRLAPPPP